MKLPYDGDPHCRRCGVSMYAWERGRLLCDACELDMLRLYQHPVAVGGGTLQHAGKYAQPNEAPPNEGGL